eukprot:5138879-Pyramimonas_sp.AAC.1
MLSAALATGRWHDIGVIYGSEPTYGQEPSWDKFSPGTNVSRPDLIITNAAAREAIHSFRLRRVLGICSHLCLELTINVTQLEESWL